MQPAAHSYNNPGWETEEVAAAQRALVEIELARPVSMVPPYAAFRRAMDSIRIPPMATFLDVGCGVGHYATLLIRHYSELGLRYVGIDPSAAMIDQAQARHPDLTFLQRGIEQTDFAGYEIVLHSQAAEVAPNSLGLICCVLDRSPGYVIWNKIRLTGGEWSGYITEPTYAGHSGQIWVWGRTDLVGILNLTGRRFVLQAWPERADTLTAVIFPRGLD